MARLHRLDGTYGLSLVLGLYGVDVEDLYFNSYFFILEFFLWLVLTFYVKSVSMRKSRATGNITKAKATIVKRPPRTSVQKSTIE